MESYMQCDTLWYLTVYICIYVHTVSVLLGPKWCFPTWIVYFQYPNRKPGLFWHSLPYGLVKLVVCELEDLEIQGFLEGKINMFFVNTESTVVTFWGFFLGIYYPNLIKQNTSTWTWIANLNSCGFDPNRFSLAIHHNTSMKLLTILFPGLRTKNVFYESDFWKVAAMWKKKGLEELRKIGRTTNGELEVKSVTSWCQPLWTRERPCKSLLVWERYGWEIVFVFSWGWALTIYLWTWNPSGWLITYRIFFLGGDLKFDLVIYNL